MKRPIWLSIVLTAFVLGCRPPPPPPPPPAEPVKPLYLSHTVNSKVETWKKVSEWYTGSWKNWQRLLEFNPDLNKKRLQIGDVVLIPMEMVTNEAPFVVTPAPKVKWKPKAPVAKKKRETEEFVLPPVTRTVESPAAVVPQASEPATPVAPSPTEIREAPASPPSDPTVVAPIPSPESPQPKNDAAPPTSEMEALLEAERKALEKLQLEVLGNQKGS